MPAYHFVAEVGICINNLFSLNITQKLHRNKSFTVQEEAVARSRIFQCDAYWHLCFCCEIKNFKAIIRFLYSHLETMLKTHNTSWKLHWGRRKLWAPSLERRKAVASLTGFSAKYQSCKGIKRGSKRPINYKLHNPQNEVTFRGSTSTYQPQSETILPGQCLLCAKQCTHLSRREKIKRSLYIDDCGTWSRKGSQKKKRNRYLINGERLQHMILKMDWTAN